MRFPLSRQRLLTVTGACVILGALVSGTAAVILSGGAESPDGAVAEPTATPPAAAAHSPVPSQPTGTAHAEPSPSGTPQAGAVFPVAWVPGYSLPQEESAEVRPPLADVVDGEAVWRLYMVEGEGDPRLLLESERWLRTPQWLEDGRQVTVPYFTRVEGAGHVFGYLSLEVGSGSVRWDFISDEPPYLYPSPDGTSFVVEDDSEATPPFLRGRYHVASPEGEGLTLEGFVQEGFAGWSPDGRYFISSGFPGRVTNPGEQGRDYYLLEPGRDEIVLLGTAPVGSGLGVSWSGDSSMLAFTEVTDLVVFDLETRELTSISLGAEVTGIPSWTQSGQYVAAGDALVDVSTGKLVVQAEGDNVITSAASPDGTRLAMTTDIFGYCQPPAVQQGNLTLLKDVASGRESVLFDCDDGVDTLLRWLAPDRLLVWSPGCYACESNANRIKLVTFPQVGVHELTDGLEFSAEASVSPDGTRVLVSGSRLRLYDLDGALLREINSPPGTRVEGISWSPDGSMFSHIVGPATINLPP